MTTSRKATRFTKGILELLSSVLEADELVEVDGEIKKLKDTFLGHEDAAEDISIIKLEPEKRLAWGWASVSKLNGESVVDQQGDVIDTDLLQEAAHEFISKVRAGKVMHDGHDVAEIVESIVFTKALQDALGIDLGREGWFICYKIHDAATWRRVQSGELRAFSIGGAGVRTPMTS